MNRNWTKIGCLTILKLQERKIGQYYQFLIRLIPPEFNSGCTGLFRKFSNLNFQQVLVVSNSDVIQSKYQFRMIKNPFEWSKSSGQMIQSIRNLCQTHTNACAQPEHGNQTPDFLLRRLLEPTVVTLLIRCYVKSTIACYQQYG